MPLILVAGPAAEPVSVSDMISELELPIYSDSGLAGALNSKLSGYILAARADCESYTRRCFLTQRWRMTMDNFPRLDPRFVGRRHHRTIMLPNQPFQSIESFEYIDLTGTLVALPQDLTNGAAAPAPFSYRLDPGGDTQPARLTPSWLQVWPLSRHLDSAIQIQFKCGYGGPVTATMTAGSALLVGPVFNQGDVGQAVSVPGAGVAGAVLAGAIASVDGNGQATLSAAAVTAVAGATAWAGAQVPPPIVQAIKFLVSFYYQQTSVVDQPMPRVVRALLDPYRNLVS